MNAADFLLFLSNLMATEVNFFGQKETKGTADPCEPLWHPFIFKLHIYSQAGGLAFLLWFAAGTKWLDNQKSDISP